LKQYKSMLVWVVLILLFVFIYQGLRSGGTGEEISFTQFINASTTATGDEAVDDVKVRGQLIEGTYKSGKVFRTSGDLKDFHKDLIAKGVDITYEREDANALWISILSTWLPMLLLLGLFFFFMRQLQSGGSRAMSFGKSRAKMMTENTNKVTFEDVISTSRP